MNRKVGKALAVSLAAISYAAPIGLAIRNLLGYKSSKSSNKPARSTSAKQHNNEDSERTAPWVGKDQKLQSLSLSTPGDAPLDRLARIASQEEHGQDQTDHSARNLPALPEFSSPRPAEDNSIDSLLQHQSLAANRLEGWSVPAPERLPVPTHAPAIMAFGIIVFAMGLATTWYVCVAGSLVFALAAWRWVGELQGE